MQSRAPLTDQSTNTKFAYTASAREYCTHTGNSTDVIKKRAQTDRALVCARDSLHRRRFTFSRAPLKRFCATEHTHASMRLCSSAVQYHEERSFLLYIVSSSLATCWAEQFYFDSLLALDRFNRYWSLRECSGKEKGKGKLQVTFIYMYNGRSVGSIRL